MNATRMMIGTLLLATSVAAAGRLLADEDAPHWIGLDTTIRDQQSWTAPVEMSYAGALDAWLYDLWPSAGKTVYGMPIPGFLLFIR